MPTWDTAADFDDEQDSSNAVAESVSNTDHSNGGTVYHGYKYESLANEYSLYGSSLVGWWPLYRTIGNAVDLSNGNDGTINGATGGVVGRSGLQATFFDGADDYIGLPNGIFGNLFSGGNDYSIVASFYLTESNLASNRNTIFHPRNSYDVSLYANFDGDIRYSTFDGTTNPAINYAVSNVGGSETWIHVVATHTAGGNMELWVNNSSVGTDTQVNPNSRSGENTIGRQRSANPQRMQGSIADVRVYDKVLSSSEITTLYEWMSGDYVEPPDNDDGGVSYYNFNVASADDQWGTNDLSVDGAVHDSTAGPRSDGAYVFDGTDDDLGGTDVGFQDDVTVSYWFNADATSGWMVNTYGTNAWFISGFGHGSVASGNVGFQVDDGSSNVAVDSNVSPILDTWYHVAGMYDSTDSELRIYINGQLENTASVSFGTADYNNPLAIGANNNNNGNYFDGTIDEVRIYNRALDSWEVRELYQYGTLGRNLLEHVVRA